MTISPEIVLRTHFKMYLASPEKTSFKVQQTLMRKKMRMVENYSEREFMSCLYQIYFDNYDGRMLQLEAKLHWHDCKLAVYYFRKRESRIPYTANKIIEMSSTVQNQVRISLELGNPFVKGIRDEDPEQLELLRRYCDPELKFKVPKKQRDKVILKPVRDYLKIIQQ